LGEVRSSEAGSRVREERAEEVAPVAREFAVEFGGANAVASLLVPPLAIEVGIAGMTVAGLSDENRAARGDFSAQVVAPRLHVSERVKGLVQLLQRSGMSGGDVHGIKGPSPVVGVRRKG
jgi:hypothetical protein